MTTVVFVKILHKTTSLMKNVWMAHSHCNKFN